MFRRGRGHNGRRGRWVDQCLSGAWPRQRSAGNDPNGPARLRPCRQGGPGPPARCYQACYRSRHGRCCRRDVVLRNAGDIDSMAVGGLSGVGDRFGGVCKLGPFVAGGIVGVGACGGVLTDIKEAAKDIEALVHDNALGLETRQGGLGDSFPGKGERALGVGRLEHGGRHCYAQRGNHAQAGTTMAGFEHGCPFYKQLANRLPGEKTTQPHKYAALQTNPIIRNRAGKFKRNLTGGVSWRE